MKRFNEFLDRLSDFFAHRKGLLPLTGILLVAINGLIQFYPGTGWLVEADLLLHIGVILALFGIMLAWAL